MMDWDRGRRARGFERGRGRIRSCVPAIGKYVLNHSLMIPCVVAALPYRPSDVLREPIPDYNFGVEQRARVPLKIVEVTYRYDGSDATLRPRPVDADEARSRLDAGTRAMATLLDGLREGAGVAQRIITFDPRDLGTAAAAFFTDNADFYGGSTREQDPILSFQGHAIYNFANGVWASFDATYFTGGRTTIDGTLNADLQQNWRLGATLAVPVDPHNSIKLYASSGVSARTGNNFDRLGIAWQYRWGGGL